MSNLPSDVFRESRCRLPLVDRDDLDTEAQRIFDGVSDPRSGSLAGLQGPTGIWLHSEKLAGPALTLNRLLRTESGLGPRLTELAILVAAREMDSQFEWTMHEPVALKAGLDPNIVDLIKYRRPTTGIADKDALVIALGRELFGERKVSSRTYGELVRTFGHTGVVNLVALMTNYAATAYMLTAFDQQLPPDRKGLLPTP